MTIEHNKVATGQELQPLDYEAINGSVRPCNLSRTWATRASYQRAVFPETATASS